MKGFNHLIPAILRTIILPPVIVLIICHHLSINRSIQLVSVALCLPVSYILRTFISVYITKRQAKVRGVTDIPRVEGKWPLNLDVLVDWSRSGSEEEAGRMMVILERRYGTTYNTRVLGEDQILTSDPSVMKHVLADQFDNFVKGSRFQDRAEGFLGNGIFNSDGEMWKFHRALTRPSFHPSHVNPSLFIPHITRFIGSLPDGPFDIQARLAELALEISIKWMCGKDIGKHDEELPDEWRVARDGLGEALGDAERVVGRRMKIGTVWPLFELTEDPLVKPMKIIRGFFGPLIDQAVQRKEIRRTESSDSENRLYLIDRLVDATTDRKLVEDQLINIFLASRDTTYSLLTFSSYILALHPEVSDRIRDEVLSVAGVDGEVTKEIIRDCKISRAFINEVLRLFPPIPLNIRRSIHSSLLPNPNPNQSPFYMPANTSIVMAIILMQRSKDVWGPDAEEFDLDRWLKPEGLSKLQREGFMSWNIGPRMCLGQPFALTVAHTFLILLFQHFHLRTQNDGGDGVPKDVRLKLAHEAQPVGTAMPESWKSVEGGDGRGRSGRERVWVVADVVLGVKGGLWIKIE